MIVKYLLLAVVAFSGYTAVNGDDCIPQMVQDLRINANATLTWEVNELETCDIAGFRVDAYGDLGDEYHFTVPRTYVDFNFLEICEEWQFVVIPISEDGVLGFERHLTEYIPLPPSADISISYFNVSQLNTRDVFLEWDLTNHTHGDCTLRYRITIEDMETGLIQDIYATGLNVHLSNLSPCVTYHLGVRAVNRAHPTIEGPMRYHDIEIPAQPEDPPRLRSVEATATTIDMSWRLENPGRNRCPVRNLYVDGGNHFNISIPIVDSLERPPVEFGLKGLKANSMYLMRISVENSGGISAPATIAVQTLEMEPGK